MGKKNHTAPTKWIQIYDPGQDPNEVNYATRANYKRQKRIINILDLEAGLMLYCEEKSGGGK